MASIPRINENPATVIPYERGDSPQAILNQPTILVATADSAISDSMIELFQPYPLKAIWAKAVAEVRAVLANERIAACFCGFWLVDGTYRDVVRHLKRQPFEIPTIVVCEPSCSHEYRDYLAALNIRAFDFICHPYAKSDLERILQAAIPARDQNQTRDQSALRKAG